MLIVGAKGFAKEVLEVVHQLNELENLVFYDDVSEDVPERLFEKFPVLRCLEQVDDYFKTVDNRFTIGIGNPVLRKKMYDKFAALGGVFISTISPLAIIGSYGVHVGFGNTILPGAILSNSTELGKGCIIYYNSVITHDCKIGDFVEISPSATILGRCLIGSYSQIGANSTILPGVTIGKNVIIGAGSVVTKDVSDNCLVVGIPAIIKKELTSLEF
ncbi:acetyltransferase [Flavobacterium sp. XN-5]|uniref:acetyltransferase n=1 Tax=Flavobacterium sp. XN-5 TaxID=2599390 RepID=UPI0011CC7D1D|nr:acetyltransferase [Flavobacterium sp. XN-5]NGY37444.1 acetyltransferase [Flavobacterium sp. XN-5]